MFVINLLEWHISFTCRKGMAKCLNLQIFFDNFLQIFSILWQIANIQQERDRTGIHRCGLFYIIWYA